MTLPARERVVVIGAGIGGLVAALGLAIEGADVTVVERAATPGGKLSEAHVGGVRIDAGPTVFTLRDVFDDLFSAAGTSLDAHLKLRPVDVLARHAWDADTRLDLYADPARTADAIGAFAGAAEARRYLAFSAHARAVFTTLDQSFIRAPSASPLSLMRKQGLRHGGLWHIQPFATLWQALGRAFTDPRLQQLFGRYATYSGSSPFAAPATLMLIAHVEQAGVWTIDGGMHRIAVALATLAARHGALLRYGTEASGVTTDGARANGVQLANGEWLAADTVVANADVAALAAGLFGRAAAAAVPAVAHADRSLSALTWALHAGTSGFPLAHHNVFFSADYRAEFDDLFTRRQLPRAPTVYVCAQDRGGTGAPAGAERLFCLVNAPPTGDGATPTAAEIARCEASTFTLMQRCGLAIARSPALTVVTTPADFAQRYPATGGALYGRASHGWRASFQRPTARTRLPGLYVAGGSTHPGAGVPMAALSGRMAASAVLADWASRSRSRTTAMHGGMQTQ